MKSAFLAVLSVLIISCAAQRSPYAYHGFGYPTLKPTEAPLENRFNEDGTPTTTMRLPMEALGDYEMVKQQMKLPEDHQPFWLLNWQALEQNRGQPHTYSQRQNGFLD